MAVIVQYIVERNGTQKMTFTDRKEAEEYDKQLEISENLFALLGTSGVAISEEQLDEISFFLAKNKDEAISILKGAKLKADSTEKTKAAKPKPEAKKPDSTQPKMESDEPSKSKTVAA